MTFERFFNLRKILLIQNAGYLVSVCFPSCPCVTYNYCTVRPFCRNYHFSLEWHKSMNLSSIPEQFARKHWTIQYTVGTKSFQKRLWCRAGTFVLKTHTKLTKWKHTSVVQTQNRNVWFGGLHLRTGQQSLDKSRCQRVFKHILQHAIQASRAPTAGPHELCRFCRS